MLTQAHFTERNEDRYSGIKTADIVSALEPQGWTVLSASARNKYKGDKDEAYHVTKLENDRYKFSSTENLNIVLINSNDGSSSFIIKIGIFRTVCSNGLIVGDDLIEPLYIPHKGYITKMIPDVLDIYLHKALNHIENKIDIMKNKMISYQDQLIFAEKAFLLKHEISKYYTDPNQLLKTVRDEDNGSDLWTIYNVVQEHLIHGDYEIENRESDKDPRKARKITSPKSDVELNSKLFDLAMEYA
jgi:hypothetical protein